MNINDFDNYFVDMSDEETEIESEYVTFKDFVSHNETDLRNMFDILKHRIEVTISFDSFCKFCYEHTL